MAGSGHRPGQRTGRCSKWSCRAAAHDLMGHSQGLVSPCYLFGVIERSECGRLGQRQMPYFRGFKS